MSQAIPILIDDDFRVKTLHSLGCLDTPNDARLDLANKIGVCRFPQIKN